MKSVMALNKRDILRLVRAAAAITAIADGLAREAKRADGAETKGAPRRRRRRTAKTPKVVTPRRTLRYTAPAPQPGDEPLGAA